MNNTETAKLDNPVLPEGFSKAVATRDFYFAAYCLTLQDPKVNLVTLKPFQYKGGTDKALPRNIRYDIILGVEGVEDAEAFFDRLHLDFVSRKTTVEPVTYNAAKESLRALMANTSEKMNRQRKGRRNNGRHHGNR